VAVTRACTWKRRSQPRIERHSLSSVPLYKSTLTSSLRSGMPPPSEVAAPGCAASSLAVSNQRARGGSTRSLMIALGRAAQDGLPEQGVSLPQVANENDRSHSATINLIWSTRRGAASSSEMPHHKSWRSFWCPCRRVASLAMALAALRAPTSSERGGVAAGRVSRAVAGCSSARLERVCGESIWTSLLASRAAPAPGLCFRA
jgi:hypothetical protein